MAEQFVAPSSDAAVTSIVNRQLISRWGKHQVFFTKPEGFVGVPDAFLRLYSKLKPYPLTTGEAMFVLELMSFKWTEDAPFPSYSTIAVRMGITDKQARRYGKALDEKGYVVRSPRIGSTNSFDLQPLFNALAQAMVAEPEV